MRAVFLIKLFLYILFGKIFLKKWAFRSKKISICDYVFHPWGLTALHSRNVFVLIFFFKITCYLVKHRVIVQHHKEMSFNCYILSELSHGFIFGYLPAEW